MARLLLPIALALGWVAALAAASTCPVSITRLGPTAKRGPVRKSAGSKVTITADIQITEAVDNVVIALFLPADFKLLKTWTSNRALTTKPIVDGQVGLCVSMIIP
jgi:hypothetical protein